MNLEHAGKKIRSKLTTFGFCAVAHNASTTMELDISSCLSLPLIFFPIGLKAFWGVPNLHHIENPWPLLIKRPDRSPSRRWVIGV